MGLGVDASISNLALDAVASKTDMGWAWTCLGPTWRWTRSLPDPTWGSRSGSRQGKGKPAPAPCDAWLNLAQGQVSPSARCPHMGVRAWLTPRAAPPKLEVIIFSLTIYSVPNTSQWKDNPTPPLLPLQLFVARAELPLHCFNPQYFESK
jgi:hypothetical protein